MPPPPSLLSLLLGGAAAHSSLLFPPSRNSIDKLLAPWANGSFGHDQYPDGWGCDCVNGTAPCEVGQSCYWFSQGCTIGCARCVDVGANPNTEDLCNSSTPATVNAPEHRTFNRDVEAGSEEDWTKFNPWRAHGHAPRGLLPWPQGHACRPGRVGGGGCGAAKGARAARSDDAAGAQGDGSGWGWVGAACHLTE